MIKGGLHRFILPWIDLDIRRFDSIVDKTAIARDSVPQHMLLWCCKVAFIRLWFLVASDRSWDRISNLNFEFSKRTLALNFQRHCDSNKCNNEKQIFIYITKYLREESPRNHALVRVLVRLARPALQSDSTLRRLISSFTTIANMSYNSALESCLACIVVHSTLFKSGYFTRLFRTTIQHMPLIL